MTGIVLKMDFESHRLVWVYVVNKVKGCLLSNISVAEMAEIGLLVLACYQLSHLAYCFEHLSQLSVHLVTGKPARFLGCRGLISHTQCHVGLSVCHAWLKKTIRFRVTRPIPKFCEFCVVALDSLDFPY